MVETIILEAMHGKGLYHIVNIIKVLIHVGRKNTIVYSKDNVTLVLGENFSKTTLLDDINFLSMSEFREYL